MVEYFKLFRLIIATLCKLATIVLCTYYIANAHSYKINWSLGNYFLSQSTLGSINDSLNTIGCYILTIPISIIIVSWLLPDNKIIQTLSSLIGVTGTLGFIINGIRYGTLTDYTNFRFIQIYNVVSLEEKTKLFMEAYLQLVGQIPSILYTKIEYLKTHLNENLHTLYVDKLKT